MRFWSLVETLPIPSVELLPYNMSAFLILTLPNTPRSLTSRIKIKTIFLMVQSMDSTAFSKMRKEWFNEHDQVFNCRTIFKERTFLKMKIFRLWNMRYLRIKLKIMVSIDPWPVELSSTDQGSILNTSPFLCEGGEAGVSWFWRKRYVTDYLLLLFIYFQNFSIHEEETMFIA